MLDWLPPHKCGLHLMHNEHKDVYETVEQYFDAEDFYSVEDFQKCCETNEVWCLQWYPFTPVGFNRICASSLEMLQKMLKEQ